MAMETWQVVCSRCGKGGHKNKYIARPTVTPPPISGKCPSSSDGKHKPQWKKV